MWITLSCCWGYVEPINKILSYPMFYPFSRLTYCAYLIHPLIQVVSKHNIESTIHLNHYFAVNNFLSIIIFFKLILILN